MAYGYADPTIILIATVVLSWSIFGAWVYIMARDTIREEVRSKELEEKS